MIYNNNIVYSLVDINFAVYLCKLLMVQHTPIFPNYSFPMQGELLAIGAKYQKAGQTQQANLIYNKLLKFDPTCAPARHRLGIILFLKGDPIGAIKLIDSAIVLQPDNTIYYLSLGKILQIENRPEEAKDALRKGIINFLNITQIIARLHSVPEYCNVLTILRTDNISVVQKHRNRLVE